MNGDRRSQDGFFGVASPPSSANNRLRPQSAGTQLRQKPAAPSHQDLFATLGIDPSQSGGGGSRSSFFSNRGSTASISSLNGPPTGNTSNASMHQYGAPPRGMYTTPPPPAPAAANAMNWSGSTSRFASSTASMTSTSAPPVASIYGAPPTAFGPPPTPLGAATSLGAPPTTTFATPTPSASLFSMEDTDAFEMDDGWGCDSPSAVLSPTAALSDPVEEAAAAAASDIAADELNDEDFGWEVADADRQFGIPTPPKPTPAPPSPATHFHAPPMNHLPPAASPTGPPQFGYNNNRSSVSGPSATTHQRFQSGSTTTTSVTTTSSVTFAASVPPPATAAPPAAPLPVAGELEYTERNSWGEPWEDAEPFPDQKSPSSVASATGGPATTAVPSPLNVAAAAAESIPVANEFWGDQDDDALFDEDEHANEKWDETPVAENLAKLSLEQQNQDQDKEAASTGEPADVHQHFHQPPPPISSFAPAMDLAEPSPSRFGNSQQAYSQFQSSTSSSPSYRVHTTGFGGNSPVGFAGASSARPGVTFGSAPPAAFAPPLSPVLAPPVAFHDEKSVEGSAQENYFASSSPAKSDAQGFSQPQAEYHLHTTSGFESNPTGYQHHQRQVGQQQQAPPTEPQKDWQEHAPQTENAPWGSSSASPNKEDQFNSNANFYQHGETVAAVQLEPTHVEGGSNEQDSASVAPPFDSAASADAFHYRDNSSREEAQFYASVRDHERSSAASVGGDVSSAGATFGGSDYVGDGGFSDGNFSETRSIVGSSNASTAFGTDFPSVSEGFSAAATTFGGSDYVSDGQFSDGNVSETPSLNDSSNPSAEAGSSGPPLSNEGQNNYFGDDADNSSEPNPFQLSGNSSSAFNQEPAAASSVTDEVNPFASSSSSVQFASSTDQSFQSSSFGAPPDESSTTQGDYVSTAASLFGATAGSDVPNPFGDSSSSAFTEKELPVAVADDLFASSPTAASFGGGSFEQPPQQYNDQGYQHQHQSYDQGYQQHQSEYAQQSHYNQAPAFGQPHAVYKEPAHFGQTASPASAGELFGQSQGSFDGFSSSSSAFGQQQQNEVGYAQQQQVAAESAHAVHNQFGAGGADHHFGQHAGHSDFGSETQATQAFDAGSPGSHFGHSSAHSYAGSTSSQQAPPTHEYAHSAHSDSMSNSGFSESHPSTSAQGFFGGASTGAASFTSSNEFFGGASAGGSNAAEEPSHAQQQSQPSLSRGTSDASAYSEQTTDYHQSENQYQQSWSQPGSFAPSGHADGSFSAPPPAHESFGTSAPPAGDVRQIQSSPSYGSSEFSQQQQQASQTPEAPVSAASPFGHVHEASGQSSFGQASNAPPPTAASFPPAVADPLPQQQDDASSNNYFGSTDASGHSGFGDQFVGHATDSSSMFGAPPPQHQQQPSASSSYFGGQSAPAPPSFGGFEQPAPRGFGQQPPSSEFFSSAPQQQHQNAPAAPAGAAFGANSSPYQAPAPQASYQQQQSFHQPAHGYGATAPAPAPQAPQAPGNFNNYAAQGASSAQTGNYYGQTAAAATAVGAAPYGGADYNTPAHTGYGAAADAYGAAQHKQASAPMARSNKYKDPCVPAPSCLASFGFGGNVVTMFPKRKLRLNIAGSSFRNSPRALVPSHPGDSSALGELRKGPVGVYRMEQIHPQDRHFEQLEAFPGPLTENVSEDVVMQYLDDQLQDPAPSSTQLEDERLLLGILKILVKCNGKLRSDPTANPSDPDSPEVQLVTLLRESDHRRRRGNQPLSFPPPRPVQTGLHPDLLAKNANTIRDLLLVGDRKAAVDVAIHAQMWPEAMLIASFTDKDEYKRVLKTYLEGHYSIGDPCRALYMSFADQQEKSVQEPQKLLQLSHHHKQQQQEHSSSILSSWVTHAQVILANRTGDTSKILVELGDRLWKETGSILAAHACYLSAGIGVEAPSPSSKIALLGADHRTPKEARFYVSSSAVQRTEIYEWIQKRSSGSTTNMIPFQGYKLIYAMILADHGKLETSFKYVSSMLSVIKAVTANIKPGTSMYLEGMQNQLTVLDDRLRQHLGQHRVNSVASSSNTNKQGKWGFGSALSIMGKIVNRVVEGNDGSGAVPSAPSGQQNGSGSSLFPGAPRSSSAGGVPAYPSTPTQTFTAGYGQQQAPVGQPAPLSNDARSTPVAPLRAPSPSYPGYGQQQVPPTTSAFEAPRSNDRKATPPPYQSSPVPAPTYPGYGQQQQGFQNTPRSNDFSGAPTYPGTPSQSFQGYGQQQPAVDPFTGAPRSNNGAPGYPRGAPSPAYPGYGQQQPAPRSNDLNAPAPGYPGQQTYPGYSQQPTPRSNDANANYGYQQQQQQQQQQSEHSQGAYPSYGQQHAAPRSNDSNAGPEYPRDPSQSYPAYGQQGGGSTPMDNAQFGAQGTPQFGPSSTSSQGGAFGFSGVATTPSNAFGGNPQAQFGANGPHSQDRFVPPARSNTVLPPRSTGSADNNGPPSSQGNGAAFATQPQYQQQPHLASQQHFSNSAPSSMPASPSSFQKPTLDLSGDAGKGLAVPPRRASDNSRSPTGGAAPPAVDGTSSGPSSDKGSASPKFKDAKKTARSKTPPPSGSKSSSWLSGLVGDFIAKKMNPEAKVAKLGERMEAYFDEEKKRWVFPGETAVEEPVMPSAPPTGPLPGSTPSSSSGGPPGAMGPPGTHSAPGSISGGPVDPLAALMAPPPARANAALMKKDPLSAMMAPPPMRPGMLAQRGASMGAQRKPPRPQFAVFKPAPQATNPAVEE